MNTLPTNVRPMRLFVLYLGNPPVKTAQFQAYSADEAWDYARELYGTNTFWPDARLNEVMEESNSAVTTEDEEL